jgi:hypothetical protein
MNNNIAEVKIEPKAVTVARAHADALYKGDATKMRSLLAEDVHYTLLNTMPSIPGMMNFPGMDNTGIENFMRDVMSGPPDWVVPGSVRILRSIGDDLRALLVVNFESALGLNGTKMKMIAARHYTLNEGGKIRTEQVILFHYSMAKTWTRRIR